MSSVGTSFNAAPAMEIKKMVLLRPRLLYCNWVSFFKIQKCIHFDAAPASARK
jgi:hypothetical protein